MSISKIIESICGIFAPAALLGDARGGVAALPPDVTILETGPARWAAVDEQEASGKKYAAVLLAAEYQPAHATAGLPHYQIYLRVYDIDVSCSCISDDQARNFLIAIPRDAEKKDEYMKRWKSNPEFVLDILMRNVPEIPLHKWDLPGMKPAQGHPAP